MTYLFFMYDKAGRKREAVTVQAASDREAWEKMGDYAYERGHADYDRTTYCDVNTCSECPRYGDDCDGRE